MRDLPKIIQYVEGVLEEYGKGASIKIENVISVETEKMKMKKYPDNMLYVPELNEEDIINYYSNKSSKELDEEIPKDFQDTAKIIEILYRALNEADDILEFLKDAKSMLGNFTNSNDTGGFINTQTMFSYPEIDINALINHEQVGWLFAQ